MRTWGSTSSWTDLADRDPRRPRQPARPAACRTKRLQPEQHRLPHQAALGNRAADAGVPAWLRLLRSLFSGVYTVDNMDFVLRDSYMSRPRPAGLRPGPAAALQLLHRRRG